MHVEQGDSTRRRFLGRSQTADVSDLRSFPRQAEEYAENFSSFTPSNQSNPSNPLTTVDESNSVVSPEQRRCLDCGWPGPTQWFAVFVFGTLGTYLRLVLSGESKKPEIVFGSVSIYWSCNIIGTLIIAFAVALGPGSVFWTKVLHRGITVGFCGGLTTFSSFVAEVIGMARTPEGANDAVENVMLTLFGAFGAYFLGWHFEMVVAWLVCKDNEETTPSVKWGAVLFLILSLVLFVLLAIGMFSFSNDTDRRDCSAAIAGGFGSLLRFTFALALNKAGRSFCVGTFSANMSAAILVCVFKRFGSDDVYIIFGSGFCGGFSTLSSLCNDFMVSALRAQESASPVKPMLNAYAYLVATMIGGLLIAALLLPI